MKNLKSVKSTIIDRGICLGIPAIKFLFVSDFSGTAEICLNSGVNEYFDVLNSNIISDLLDNYENEFFYFENPLTDWENANYIISKLKEKNNYIFISNYFTDDLINKSREFSKVADMCEIQTSLDSDPDKIADLAKELKDIDLSLLFDIYPDSSVLDFDQYAEKLSEIDENIKLILNPQTKLFSKDYIKHFPYIIEENQNISQDNENMVCVRPDKDLLLAMCHCGNAYLETKVIKEMKL